MLAVSLVYNFLLITIAQSAALGGQQTTTALVAYGLFAAAEHVFLLAHAAAAAARPDPGLGGEK